jgi:hypothetical protein
MEKLINSKILLGLVESVILTIEEAAAKMKQTKTQYLY